MSWIWATVCISQKRKHTFQFQYFLFFVLILYYFFFMTLFGHKVQIIQEMDIDKIRLTPEMCLIQKKPRVRLLSVGALWWTQQHPEMFSVKIKRLYLLHITLHASSSFSRPHIGREWRRRQFEGVLCHHGTALLWLTFIRKTYLSSSASDRRVDAIYSESGGAEFPKTWMGMACVPNWGQLPVKSQ